MRPWLHLIRCKEFHELQNMLLVMSVRGLKKLNYLQKPDNLRHRALKTIDLAQTKGNFQRQNLALIRGNCLVWANSKNEEKLNSLNFK